MFKFLKNGFEYNNLANAMNAMYISLQDIMRKMESSPDRSEFAKEILFLAYVSRRSIWDRMEKYGWSMELTISVPSISRDRVKLTYALGQTSGRVNTLAREIGIKELANEILVKGKAYYEFESTLPQQIINSIK